MPKRQGRGQIRNVSKGVSKANNTLGALTSSLDQVTQSIQQIQVNSQAVQDSNQSDAKVLMSIKIQQAQLELQKDQTAFLKKISDGQNKQIEALQKGNKDWKTVGDKFKDLKRNLSDALDPDTIKKAMLGPFSMFKGVRNKVEDIDYAKRMKALGSTKSSSELKDDSKKQRAAKMDALRAQSDIDRLKKMGANDDQISNSKAAKQRNAALKTYNDYNKVDNGATASGKSAKDAANPMGGNTAAKSASLVPAEKAKLTSLPTGPDSQEAQVEQMRAMSAIADNIQLIADNTSMMVNKDQEGNKKQGKSSGLLSGLGDLVGNIMGMLSDSLMSSFKTLFSFRSILKVISKVFAPAMIIGSLFSGIMDGFQAWKETGSISEALIAGVGGVLKFLTFGIFDADTVRSVVGAVKGFVNDYIVNPVTNFINSMGDMFNQYIAQPVQAAFQGMMQWGQDLFAMLNDFLITPISNAIKPLKDFFVDMGGSMMNFLKNIQIPGVSFKIPMYGDVSFGPWKPFEQSDAKSADKTAAAAPTPQSGNAVSSASKSNADEQAKLDGSRGTTVVSAPTQNVSNSNQTNVIKPPVRNSDSSYNRYLSQRFA